MPRTQVLIVGAGPTGLSLAVQLRRHGIACRVIDKHAGVLELTKSAALHARTLEHFRDLGVADRIMAEGQRVDHLVLRTGYRDRIAVDFRTLHDTAYPHMVDIPQARTEHILIDRLADTGVTVERSTTCTGIRQTGDGVLATVTTADGSTTTIAADWLVGCDGVKSTVRSLIGKDFTGAAYADDWVLCDAVVDWPLPRNEMTFSGDKEGIYGVFPLPGERRYRLAYTQRRDRTGKLLEPDLADAQEALVRTGIRGTIRSVDQFWTFGLAHRQATGYRSGRVFLAGDAGHVHTPFGGQGLNLGVADAVNLGWKLAAVIRGTALPALLESYEKERHHVARRVVAFTHLGATAMLLRRDPRRHLRDAVMKTLQATPPVRRTMARRLSQLAHDYRGSQVVRGRARHLRAGDRLPDPLLFDGATDRPVRLHDMLPNDRHTLLITGGGDPGRLVPAARRTAAALGRRWPGLISTRLLTTDWATAGAAAEAELPALLDRGRDAAVLYGRGPTAYLIRPDRHLGYAGPLKTTRIQEYLAMLLTPAPSPDGAGTTTGTAAASTFGGRS
ncbi:FAD-dependent monooxygenase [Streptomyces aidingensis]|uniref:2-polyprenyl-6-methoxyphenol hydroxylase n=1 Tax=Streptomyces aidingensis TaxID=910347 RepID=A0A1I1H5B9_9ACTN|nr:FAD-dependent monooxygenase [Streptomyces aidingensis]SFC19369.1 2-polyprenyl-6-methoxyphenol hydroxylase [Streptomyces aidingensis]